MPTEVFNREQFEAALPTDSHSGNPLWASLGDVAGEYQYVVPVKGTNKRIVIRSSVRSDTGVCAATGDDSIRLWAEYCYQEKWYPLGKLDRWTTRQPGWQNRVQGKIKELRKLAIDDSTKRRQRSIPNDAPECPKCKKPMMLRERRSDNQKFWGCSQFPRCRGSRKYSRVSMNPECPAAASHAEVLAAKERCPECNGNQAAREQRIQPKADFKPSVYQTAIFQEVQDGTNHLVVEAVPGSGKTTTIVRSLDLLSKDLDTAFVAFNKRIAKELAKRAPQHVYVSTLHSLGFANLKSGSSKAKFQENKVMKILYRLADEAPDLNTHKRIKTVRSTVARLVSLCKATLREPTAENVEWLADRFSSVELNDDADFILALTQKVYRKCVTTVLETFDYDDMIHASATGIVTCRTFDALNVDELQDLNAAQIEMVMQSIKPNGRIIGVGDRYQSIYGFRGADTEAIPNAIAALSAKTLPLSITYRCPKAHVAYLQTLMPHIEAAPWAEDGILDTIASNKATAMMQSGDLVICRCNAPLVGPAFELIRRGVKAVILGRDIGKGLLALVDKISEQFQVFSLSDILISLREYKNAECSKLMDLGKSIRAQMLEDKYETIAALCDGISTKYDLERRIAQVFSDDEAGVTFSSVHKIKGGEADKVFILKPELMPHPKATNEWELEQERNIKIVAYSRSKSEIYRVVE